MSLFPEFAEQRTLGMQYAYVEHVMCKLAEANELFLTDCLAQDPAIRQRVAEICMGIRIELSGGNVGEQTQGHDLPEILDEWRVKLRAIPHAAAEDEEADDGTPIPKTVVRVRPIRFRYGSRKVTDGMTYEQAKLHLSSWRKGEEVEPVWIDTGKTEVELPLKKACACLMAQGKDVRPANSPRKQKNLWKVEEVRPGEPDKPRRGRPRKDLAVEVASAE